MTKFDELPAEQKRYIETAMDKMGVNPWLVSEADIDAMLENFNPPASWFDRLKRANEAVASYNRERAEKAGPMPVALPSEAERNDFAKRLNVRPEHVRTAEQDAAEKLAAEQLEQFQTASESKSTYDLVQIGNDKNHPHWESARARISEYFPSFDSWSD